MFSQTNKQTNKGWIAPYGSLYIFNMLKYINVFICAYDKIIDIHIYIIQNKLCHKSFINTEELVPILCHEHFLVLTTLPMVSFNKVTVEVWKILKFGILVSFKLQMCH